MSTSNESNSPVRTILDEDRQLTEQLTDVDYYTKAETDTLLALKADADDVERDAQDFYVSNDTNWKVTFHRLAVGIVTITVHLKYTYPATHTGGYHDILTGIPAKFRPAENLYFMASDYQTNKRIVGVFHSGVVRVYDSPSTGCYGTTTYMS